METAAERAIKSDLLPNTRIKSDLAAVRDNSRRLPPGPARKVLDDMAADLDRYATATPDQKAHAAYACVWRIPAPQLEPPPPLTPAQQATKAERDAAMLDAELQRGANALLDRLEPRGITVRLRDGVLIATPARLLTTDDRRALSAVKAQLPQVLAERRVCNEWAIE